MAKVKKQQEQSDFDKFNVEEQEPLEALTEEVNQEEVKELLDMTPDPYEKRSPTSRALGALISGRGVKPLEVKPDADPLYIRAYELLTKMMAAGIIAPFAYLAITECEKLVEDLERHIKLEMTR